MHLVSLSILLISSFSTCELSFITPDLDDSIALEITNTNPPSAVALGELLNHQKDAICEGIINSSYFRRFRLLYIEKPDVYTDFSRECEECIQDHYNPDNIEECFVVRDQNIIFHNNLQKIIPTFGCIAEITDNFDDPYYEIFVSYSNVSDTFLISLRGNGDHTSMQENLHYLGISEPEPMVNQHHDIAAAENFFRTDNAQPGNTLFRLNEMSSSRRNRLCKMVVVSIHKNVHVESVRSSTILPNARVYLFNEFLNIDGVLRCTIHRQIRYNLALSKTNQHRVHLFVKQQGAANTLRLTDYYIEEIPALKNN